MSDLFIRDDDRVLSELALWCGCGSGRNNPFRSSGKKETKQARDCDNQRMTGFRILPGSHASSEQRSAGIVPS
jgi:hypothetical protein